MSAGKRRPPRRCTWNHPSVHPAGLESRRTKPDPFSGPAREALITAATVGTGQLARGVGQFTVSAAQRLATRMGVSTAAQANLLCWATTTARLYQPVATVQQLANLSSGIVQAREAIARGDYEAAATGLFRTGFAATTLPGSLRETMRFGRALTNTVSGNPAALRDYLAACFAAGTPILWEHGSKPVEEFKPGDRVWARSEFDPDAPVQQRQSEECFQTEARIWHLHVDGQLIRTTDEHPFWVRGRGWTRACDLRRGDELVGRDGEIVAVEEVSDSGETETVYNFRVAEDHTYFVGSATWGFSVWAHNLCMAPIPRSNATGTWNPRPARPNDPRVMVYGTAQVTNGPNGPAHAAAINNQVAQLAASAPPGSYFVLNRSWRTATGGTSSSNLRPDILFFERLSNGQYRVSGYEFASPSQQSPAARQALLQSLLDGWNGISNRPWLAMGTFQVI